MSFPLPNGYSLEIDDDGDWLLCCPPDVTIFSEPGEPWFIGTCDEATALEDAVAYLKTCDEA
jgi:hypothetical protein